MLLSLVIVVVMATDGCKEWAEEPSEENPFSGDRQSRGQV